MKNFKKNSNKIPCADLLFPYTTHKPAFSIPTYKHKNHNHIFLKKTQTIFLPSRNKRKEKPNEKGATYYVKVTNESL